LIREKKYLILLVYYAEVIVLSFLFFCLGYFITLTFIN
jgi:CrcB protein